MDLFFAKFTVCPGVFQVQVREASQSKVLGRLVTWGSGIPNVFYGCPPHTAQGTQTDCRWLISKARLVPFFLLWPFLLLLPSSSKLL